MRLRVCVRVCACTTALPSLFAADIDVFAFVVIHDVVSSRRMLLNVVGWCHITTTWARNYNILHIFSLRFLFFLTHFLIQYRVISVWAHGWECMCVCTLHTFCILFTGVQHFVCSFHFPDEKRSKIQIIETTTTKTNITAMQKKVCHPASCVLNVPQQQVAYKIHKIPIVGCCCHSVNMILCIDDSKCLKVESHKQLITFVW